MILTPAREHIEGFLLRYIPLLEITPNSHDLRRDLNSMSRGYRTLCENAIRSFLVVFTLTVAAHFPYFSAVLGSVGGFTDALQAFVVPSLIGLRVFGERLPWELGYFYRFVSSLGLLIMMHTVIKLVNRF